MILITYVWDMFLLEVNAQKHLINTSNNHTIVAISRNFFNAAGPSLQKPDCNKECVCVY
jgi:hypothetical protein